MNSRFLKGQNQFVGYMDFECFENQEKQIEVMMDFFGQEEKVTIYPLSQEAESVGALLMLTRQTPYYTMDETLLEFIKDVIEQEIESCV